MSVENPHPRSIKSFVLRTGRITPAQKHALDTLWPAWGIEFVPGPLELPAGFDAVNLEIGIGNGDALLEMAAGDPRSLYLGVEVHLPGIGRCLNGIEQRQLANVRLIRHDAIEVLEQMIAPGSIDRILLFFPDPWPKKRHHKRRIVNHHFRDLVHQALKPGGELHAATDWRDYAEWIAAEFLGDERFANRGDAEGYSETPEWRPRTHFERRGLRLGHPVCDLVFAKK